MTEEVGSCCVCRVETNEIITMYDMVHIRDHGTFEIFWLLKEFASIKVNPDKLRICRSCTENLGMAYAVKKKVEEISGYSLKDEETIVVYSEEDLLESDLKIDKPRDKIPNDASDSQKPKPCYECKYCFKKFIQIDNFRRHFLRHQTPFQCEMCLKKYLDVEDLKTHVETCRIEFPVYCSVCNEHFTRYDEFKRHFSYHGKQSLLGVITDTFNTLKDYSLEEVCDVEVEKIEDTEILPQGKMNASSISSHDVQEVFIGDPSFIETTLEDFDTDLQPPRKKERVCPLVNSQTPRLTCVTCGITLANSLLFNEHMKNTHRDMFEMSDLRKLRTKKVINKYGRQRGRPRTRVSTPVLDLNKLLSKQPTNKALLSLSQIKFDSVEEKVKELCGGLTSGDPETPEKIASAIVEDIVELVFNEVALSKENVAKSSAKDGSKLTGVKPVVKTVAKVETNETQTEVRRGTRLRKKKRIDDDWYTLEDAKRSKKSSKTGANSTGDASNGIEIEFENNEIKKEDEKPDDKPQQNDLLENYEVVEEASIENSEIEDGVDDKKTGNFDHLNRYRIDYDSLVKIEESTNQADEKKKGKRYMKKPTFKCPKCQKEIHGDVMFEKHLSNHKPFRCTTCDKMFSGKESLKKHMQFIHLKPTTRHLCNLCGTSFARDSDLKVHLIRHSGIKRYFCSYCNKGFVGRWELNTHEKYHTGDRSHLCNICGKGFYRLTTLTTHIRVHTGEKPYNCKYCHRKFAQRYDFIIHMRRHTGDRFSCQFCKSEFIVLSKLREHLRSVHDIEVVRENRRFLPEERVNIADSKDVSKAIESLDEQLVDLNNEEAGNLDKDEGNQFTDLFEKIDKRNKLVLRDIIIEDEIILNDSRSQDILES